MELLRMELILYIWLLLVLFFLALSLLIYKKKKMNSNDVQFIYLGIVGSRIRDLCCEVVVVFEV